MYATEARRESAQTQLLAQNRMLRNEAINLRSRLADAARIEETLYREIDYLENRARELEKSLRDRDAEFARIMAAQAGVMLTGNELEAILHE